MDEFSRLELGAMKSNLIQHSGARYVLPSLCFTTFVQQLPNILSGLLLIEIADTFKAQLRATDKR